VGAIHHISHDLPQPCKYAGYLIKWPYKTDKNERDYMPETSGTSLKMLRNEQGKIARNASLLIAAALMALVVFLVLYVFIFNPQSPFTMVFNRSKFQYTQKMNIAMDYLYAQNYKKAQTLLEDAIRVRPQEPKAHDKLGYVFFKLGKQDRAIFEFEKAIEVDPKYDEAYANLSAIYKKAGDSNAGKADKQTAINSYLRAEKELEKALRVAPNNPDYLKMQKTIIASRQNLQK
jgi:Tfp pilus assembly protein PilF